MNRGENFHILHLLLYLFGGACTGIGILSLYFSFGRVGGPMNGDFAEVGFTGIDNIAFLPATDLSIPMVFVGVICLILANATAWRETDGY